MHHCIASLCASCFPFLGSTVLAKCKLVGARCIRPASVTRKTRARIGKPVCRQRPCVGFSSPSVLPKAKIHRRVLIFMSSMNGSVALTHVAVGSSTDCCYDDRIHSLFIHHLGPDAQGTVVLQEGDYYLSFNASELRLRGDSPVSQPHRDDQGNIFCWNGEVRGKSRLITIPDMT